MNADDKFHRWQIEALTALGRCLDLGELVALIVAAVGAGKTWMASHFAKMMLETARAERVIIVVPSRRLVTQWADTMNVAGLKLMTIAANERLNKGMPPDVSGYIVTYQSMARFPDLHATYAHSAETLVIFDEVHHLGDEDHTDWGPAARVAFENVRFCLSLSGTPYRSSGRTIPFQTYDPPDAQGRQLLHALYNYGYGQAVADGVCRRVNFKPYDGLVEFKVDGRIEQCRMADAIDDEMVSPRLNAAVQALTVQGTRNQLVANIIHDANNRLTDLRNSGHRDAGGFIVCADIEHARTIAKMVEHITGDKPIVAVSEDDRAPAQIEAFTEGESRWLISVRMISEGVDINRLRACVYLSNVTEELFFMQVMGRIVRIAPNALGESFMYLLSDERLMAHARHIEEDVAYWTKQRKQRSGGGGGGGLRHGVELIDATGEEGENIIAGDTFEPTDLRAAELLRAHHPQLYSFSIMDIARFAREARATAPAPTRNVAPPTYDEQRDEVGRELDAKIGLLAHITGQPHSHINAELNRRIGVQKRKQASVAQLIHMVALVREWIVQVENGT